MLKKVSLQPGINKEGTQYSAEGGWYDSDKIRFWKGRAEKIGGWVKLTTDTILGTCRDLHNWTSSNRDNYLAATTNVKAYLEFGGNFYDITPQMYLSTTSLGADCTDSATTINVNDDVLANSLFRIDNEFILNGTDTSAGDLTGCTREQLGTDGEAHDQYAAVFEIPKLTNPISPAKGALFALIRAPLHGLSTGDYVTFLSIGTDFDGTLIERATLLSGYASSVSTQGFKVIRVLSADYYEIQRSITGVTQGHTLGADMTDSSILITLDGAASSATEFFRVEDEYIKLTSAAAGTHQYNCLRGQFGSISASHLSGVEAREMLSSASDSTSNTFNGGTVFISSDIASTNTSYADGSGWSAGTWGGRPSSFVSATVDGPGSAPNALLVGGTTVSLDDSDSFGASGTILIDTELMTYTSNTGNPDYNLEGLTRGQLGTVAMPHTTGTTAFDVTGKWTGWNQVTNLPVNISDTSLRTWSIDNFGEDLVLCPRDGVPHFWNKSERTVRSVPQSILNTAADAAVNTGVYYSSPVPFSSMGSPRTDPASTVGDPGHGAVPSFVRVLMVYPGHRVIVAFGCTDTLGNFDPMLVRWCHPDRPGSWEVEVGSFAGGTPLSTGSYIVGAARSKREILIWTDAAVYSMVGVTGGGVFQFSELSTGISIVGPDAYSVAGDRIFWMDDRNFYVYDGSVSILPCTVLNYVFSDFNYNEREKIFAARNSKFGESTWFYCSSDSVTIDRYVTYNYVESSWYIGSMFRTAWSDSGLREYPLAAAPQLDVINVEDASYIYLHENGKDNDGAAMTAYIESGYMDIDDGENFSFVSRIVPDVRFSSGDALDIILTPKEFPNSTAGTALTSTVSSTTGQSRVRLRGRQFSIRFESDESGVGWTLGDTRLGIRQDGRK